MRHGTEWVLKSVGFNLSSHFHSESKNISLCCEYIWRRGVVAITTAQLYLTKPELRLCAGSNPARGVSEIRDGEDL